MAEHAHSTPAPIASRRRLGAGLLAVMAGSVITSGIAAGAATSVGDVVLTDADADLIAACQRVLTATKAQDVLTDPFEELSPDDPYYQSHCNAAYEEVYRISLEDYHPSIREAARLVACTSAGIVAKAHLVLETEDDRLALSLARDILAERAFT